MSIEAKIEALAAALTANTAVLEQILAGREAALAQLGQAADKPATTTRSRKKADAPAAETGTGNAAGGAASGSTAESPAASPSSAPAAPEVGDADLRAAAGTYIGGAGEDKDARGVRAANLKAITEHFGTKTLVGPEGIQEADQKAQALFFIKRFDAGLPVDFSQDYDFAGDPTQGGPVADAPADEFDIG